MKTNFCRRIALALPIVCASGFAHGADLAEPRALGEVSFPVIAAGLSANPIGDSISRVPDLLPALAPALGTVVGPNASKPFSSVQFAAAEAAPASSAAGSLGNFQSTNSRPQAINPSARRDAFLVGGEGIRATRVMLRMRSMAEALGWPHTTESAVSTPASFGLNRKRWTASVRSRPRLAAGAVLLAAAPFQTAFAQQAGVHMAFAHAHPVLFAAAVAGAVGVVWSLIGAGLANSFDLRPSASEFISVASRLALAFAAIGALVASTVFGFPAGIIAFAQANPVLFAAAVAGAVGVVWSLIGAGLANSFDLRPSASEFISVASRLALAFAAIGALVASTVFGFPAGIIAFAQANPVLFAAAVAGAVGVGWSLLGAGIVKYFGVRLPARLFMLIASMQTLAFAAIGAVVAGCFLG